VEEWYKYNKFKGEVMKVHVYKYKKFRGRVMKVQVY